jgi:uncharacterized damage-inducible protein DinB
MIDAIRRMVDHLRWADAETLESLQRPGAATPRAVDVFAHVLAAENVWISRVLGRPPAVSVWPSLNLLECASLAESTHRLIDDVVRTLDDEGGERMVHYTNSAGVEYDSKVSDIFTHMILHAMYHRGQVAMLVRDAGAEPRATDYIALVRGAPAARTARPGTLP